MPIETLAGGARRRAVLGCIGAALLGFVPVAVAAQADSRPLYLPSDAESRAITGENPTGERGKGGFATDGYGAKAARALGPGWKIRPAVPILGGATTVLADLDGPGIIRHLWMTAAIAAPHDWRSLILRMYWDGDPRPAIEVPMGDFFAMGLRRPGLVNSAAIATNPWTGFNSYWQMPFRRHARITVENLGKDAANLYYQVDYSRESVASDAYYLHAQFRDVPRTGDSPYVILDGMTGPGAYIGTYMTIGVHHPGWWGEGEVKFFLNGERSPTIVGTGTEDYFGGAWNFAKQEGMGYDTYSGLYSGLPQAIEAKTAVEPSRFAMYRWHIPDPIRFRRGVKVTIQMLGWKTPEPANGPQYDLLHEHVSTVAYWYASEYPKTAPTLPPLVALEDR